MPDKKYFQEHKERLVKYNAIWYQAHKLEIMERNKERKKQVLTFYGNGKCACVRCRESRLACLSIDHINGDGLQQQRNLGTGCGTNFYRWLLGNDFPKGYQTLCMNCQWVKRVENREYGYRNKNKV